MGQYWQSYNQDIHLLVFEVSKEQEQNSKGK